jgi:uncharacterized damage-inducible protein DinB
MDTTARYLGQLDREVERTRRVLQQVPEGHDDWRPHPKSMSFGQLVGMVASMPSWLALILEQDELDLAPPTPRHRPPPLHTRREWLEALETSAQQARDALERATVEQLASPWTLKAAGVVKSVMPRADMLVDTLAHLAHHRGQITVYLRLLDATVPALYGPSADDPRYS